MATITTTTSLSFDAAASLTVGVDKNFEGRIAFTSANDDVWPSFTVTKPQSKTYGPFGIAMTVVITVVNGSLDYTINGGNGGFGYDTDGNVTGLVSGDGTELVAIPAKRSQYVICHRGDEATQSENSMESFYAAYALGARIFETDCRETSDGVVVIMHDATTDRTTDASLTVASSTLAQVTAAKVDYLNSVGASGYIPSPVPTLSQLLQWAVDKPIVLLLECKTATVGPYVVAELQRYNFPANRVIGASYTQAWHQPLYDAGYATAMYYGGSMAAVNFSTVRSNGNTWVFGDTWLAGEVAAAKAAGLIPAIGTISYRAQESAARALGIDYMIYRDTRLANCPIRSKTTFADNKWPSGIVGGVTNNSLGQRGTVFATGGWGWAGSTATYFDGAWQEWMGPIDEPSYTITLRASIDAVAGATNWLCVFIAALEDGALTNPGAGTTEQSGYLCCFRQNGTKDIYKLTKGTALPAPNVGTNTGTALTLGTTYTLTITVTPTSISITANGSTATANDSTFRGGHVFVGRNSADITVDSIEIA